MLKLFDYNNTIKLFDNTNILLCNNNEIFQDCSNILFISEYGYSLSYNDKYLGLKKISKLIKLQQSIVFVVKLYNDDIISQKNIISNIITAYEYVKNNNISLGISFNNENVICIIFDDNYTSYTDIIYCYKALSISNLYDRYSYIYDVVTKKLDTSFYKNNYCDFQCNKCIASRNNQTVHEHMGCCYSFDYNVWKGATNVKLCQYLDNNNKCSINCMACKMFTCKFLKNQGVSFSPKRIPLLDCFFTKKQLEILTANFFVPKERIINKLLERNHLPYFLFYMFNMCRIKNY